MLKELKTTRDRVRANLEKYPKTRDSDKALINSYIYEYHRELIDENGKISLVDLYDIPSFESIRRSRQLIQRKAFLEFMSGDDEEAKYLPKDETVLKRRKMENIYHRFTSK